MQDVVDILEGLFEHALLLLLVRMARKHPSSTTKKNRGGIWRRWSARRSETSFLWSFRPLDHMPRAQAAIKIIASGLTGTMIQAAGRVNAGFFGLCF